MGIKYSYIKVSSFKPTTPEAIPPKLLSGHQTTLLTVHSERSASDLDCTVTELHTEGWKGWAYEYQNSWAICDVNRILHSDWSRTISCGKTYWCATQLSAHSDRKLGSAQLAVCLRGHCTVCIGQSLVSMDTVNLAKRACAHPVPVLRCFQSL